MLHLLWMKSQFINEMTGDANVSSFQMHNRGDLPPPENSNMKIPDLSFFLIFDCLINNNYKMTSVPVISICPSLMNQEEINV